MKTLIEFLIYTYILCSFTEWFLHKEIMHGNPEKLRKIPFLGSKLATTARSHIEHHSEVNMDMKLQNPVLSRKLYFAWDVSIYFSIVLFIFGLPIQKRFKILYKNYMIYVFSLSLIYCFLWNNLHVDMHGVKDSIDFKNGVPNSRGALSKGPLYNYLWKYHAIHHFQKGNAKGNFNIVLPGFDFLFGTFNHNCYNNTEYCKTHSDTRCQVLKNCVTDSDVLKV